MRNEKLIPHLTMKIDRRRFIAGSLATMLLPAVPFSFAQEAGYRRVFDAVSGQPIPGLKLIVKRVGSRGRWIFRTSEEGLYPFGEVESAVDDQTTMRFRIESKTLKNQHIGVELLMNLHPDPELNAGIGDIGLIPLVNPGAALGINDSWFNNNWLSLIKEIFFSVDRQPSPRPKGTAGGALARFESERVQLRFSQGFSDNEFSFIKRIAKPTVRVLSSKSVLPERKIALLPEAEIATFPEELSPGTITFAKRKDFSRPAVRLRYGNTGEQILPGKVNPHEIAASLIILDTYTLNELYRDGQGTQQQIRLAKRIVQRCIADALGWRPTVRLPHRSVVDENHGPPENMNKPLITRVDKALALAASGGGTGCYSAGTRFIDRLTPFLKTDPEFPRNRRIIF